MNPMVSISCGAARGLAVALGSLLFAAGSFDLVSAIVPAAVLITAGAAAVLPAALRAVRADPLQALRAE